MVRTLFVIIGLVACSLTLKAAPPKAAYELLPQSTQAVVWLPDSDVLTERWGRTQLAQLADDPKIKDFWQDQQGEIEEKLTSAGWRLHIQPRDLADVVSGQIALAWIERPEVVRKPYSLVLIVDVINKEAQTTEFLQKLDNQLKDRGSQRTKLTHSGVEIAQHTMRPPGGELLPQETFYVVLNEQMLASDDLLTIQGLIDGSQGKAVDKKLNSDPVFIEARTALKTSGDNQVEYFARPLGFARVLRAISGKRSKPDVLAILQTQGFDSLKAVCGEVKLGQDSYDILHRGFVLAAGKLKDRPDSVQLLDFPNDVKRELPTWISDRVSSVFATCWNAKDAFWHAEGLVDAMAGQQNVFDEIIEGIRVDPTGPQIDIRKEVIPLLTNEIYAVTEAKLPIAEDSKRNLIALRITDSEKMNKILDKAMKAEPDATQISLSDQMVWKVQHKASTEEDLGFGDFKDFADEKNNGPGPGAAGSNQPLLSNWAITVYDGFLLFASHESMIEEAIAQSKKGGKSPLTDQADFQRMSEAIAGALDKEPLCAWRVNRSAIAYRAQYELFKQGKLQGGKGMFATLLENLIQNASEIEQPKKPIIDGAKLPAFEAVSKYLQPSGTYIRSVDNGWSFGSLLLASEGKPLVPAPDAVGAANAANKPDQNAATTR